MTRKQVTQRARTLRIVGAVGAGALVLGMVTVGAAVAADTGSSDVRKSVTAPGGKKSREATPVLDGKVKKSREARPVADGNPKKSREARPVADANPRKSREARPVADANPRKSREATPVADAKNPKKSREAAPRS
jgi:hypothetical protein